MPRFAVRVEGRCLLRTLERRWLVFFRQGRQPAGFFTTRRVEATDEDAAGTAALRLVATELDNWPGGQVSVDPDQTSPLWVEAVWEDGTELAQRPADSEGFTFFTLDDGTRERAYAAEAGIASPENTQLE